MRSTSWHAALLAASVSAVGVGACSSAPNVVGPPGLTITSPTGGVEVAIWDSVRVRVTAVDPYGTPIKVAPTMTNDFKSFATVLGVAPDSALELPVTALPRSTFLSVTPDTPPQYVRVTPPSDTPLTITITWQAPFIVALYGPADSAATWDVTDSTQAWSGTVRGATGATFEVLEYTTSGGGILLRSRHGARDGHVAVTSGNRS